MKKMNNEKVNNSVSKNSTVENKIKIENINHCKTDNVCFYNHEDVMRILNVERSKSYEIIRSLNKELERNHIMTISGQVVKSYFEKRFLINCDFSFENIA